MSLLITTCCACMSATKPALGPETDALHIAGTSSLGGSSSLTTGPSASSQSAGSRSAGSGTGSNCSSQPGSARHVALIVNGSHSPPSVIIRGPIMKTSDEDSSPNLGSPHHLGPRTAAFADASPGGMQLPTSFQPVSSAASTTPKGGLAQQVLSWPLETFNASAVTGEGSFGQNGTSMHLP